MIKVVEHDEIRLWSEAIGVAEQPCALLISGAGAPAVFWPDGFCRRLADSGLFVIRYDHRDIGYSTHTDADYDIFTLLGDSLIVLDAHGVSAAHLIGHSMGGYLVALAAVHHPTRVLTATMISAGPTMTPTVAAELGLSAARPETRDALLENHPTGDFEADFPGWMRSWRLLHGSYPLDEAMARSYTQALYTRDARDASVAECHVRAMNTVPSTLANDLRRAPARSLVIHGTDDALVPVSHGLALARLIPNCRLHLLPGAGHMFFRADHWEQLAAQIMKLTA